MWVPMDAGVPVLSPNDHPKRQRKDFSKKIRNFENFQVPLDSLKTAILGLSGGHGLGYIGRVATTWVPMGARRPVLSPNNHPNPSQRGWKGFRKSRIFENFQVPMDSLKKPAISGLSVDGPEHILTPDNFRILP